MKQHTRWANVVIVAALCLPLLMPLCARVVKAQDTPLPDLTTLADFAEVELDGISFIKIPAGTFRQGTSDDDRAFLEKQNLWNPLFAPEQPTREVRITKAFLLSKYEITQKQWLAVMGPGDRRRPGNPSAFKGENLPVESVSWNDVQQFCRTLSGKSKATYRLPTEAEWEYAARAGDLGIFGMGLDKKPIGLETLGDYAWLNNNSGNKTHPVGTKKPNAWGLHDMLGNVWEWCLDAYAPETYKRVPRAENPVYRSSEATEQVLRGGCWFLDQRAQRVGLRGGNLPTLKNAYIGFRIVREL